MRLIRFGAPGLERTGCLLEDGTTRDLGTWLPGEPTSYLAGLNLQDLMAVAPMAPLVPHGQRLGSPIGRPSKIVCIGLNYHDHAQEAGMAVPVEPVVFMKASTSASGPDDDIEYPAGAAKLDWEVELGVVIGTRTKAVAVDRSLEHVLGYVLVNDVSERAWQLERGGQWDKAKSHDSFCPIGPVLVTRDELPDPQQVRLALAVNGVTRQSGHTSKMIFSVAHVVSYVSQFMTLEPGDLLCTGTPAGVGLGARPPTFLKPGDVVTANSPELGQQTCRVVMRD
jgi:2,4-didehydro-3-deoxy-L-rhamnonate hydrolase